MLRKLENYYKPSSLQEALRLADENTEGAKLIAGGTAVMAAKNNEVKTLIDIKNTGTDKIIKDENGVRAGATVTIASLLESNEIKNYCGGLIYEAAYYIASTPLRNMITLGGNIIQTFPWSDLPAALLLCGAELSVASKNNIRKLSYINAVKKHPSLAISKNEIVTEVLFPDLTSYTGKFTKFSQTNFDYAILDAGVIAKIKDGAFEDIRFAVSAAGSLPQLLSESAALLKGAPADDKGAAAKAARHAASETIFTNDKRVSIEYKKEILPALFERLIERVVKENKGGN